MGVTTASVTTNSGLDILKTLKEMFKTGWTLDEENGILWKDSPAAFPVGIWADSSSSYEYIRPVVKGPDGTPYKTGAGNTNYAYTFINTSLITHYISVYTSPNGSIGIGFSTASGVIVPTLLISKNTSTDPTKPQHIIQVFKAVGYMVPGFACSLNSYPSRLHVTYPNCFYAITWSLVNAFDLYTGTALADVYYLAGRQSSTPPDILVNGSNKYIKFLASGNEYVMYMRYV